MTPDQSASQSPDSPQLRQLLEYDWRQAGGRLMLACLIVAGIGLSSYVSIPSEYNPEPYPRCNGGLAEALKFTGALLGCVGLIESVLWSVWGASHQDTLEAQEKERSLSAQQSGNTNEALVLTPAWPDYKLVKSGGRLPLAPKGLVTGLLFAGIAAATAIVVGLPDPCSGPVWSVGSWGRYLISAYALLALCGFGVDRTIQSLDKTESK